MLRLVGLSSLALAAATSSPDKLQDPREKLGSNGQVFAAYVVNWAHYRAAPYTYTAADLAPIAHRLDVALYSFIYFCPPAGTTPMPYWGLAPYGNCNDSNEYSLMSVDVKDKEYIPAIVAMGPKVVLSIGGWNFPSAYFSKMASTAASRAKFIASVKQWMADYGISGIDLDWEFPCSPPRANPVKITCQKFNSVADAGGSCPADTHNLLSLVKELRASLGPDAVITIASQAGNKHADQMDLKAVTEYIDLWHMMSYDYAVSDVEGQSSTSPNAPLFTPVGGLQMSVDSSVKHYVNAGVPANKIMIGLPLYAHSWYTPDLKGTDWQKFGLKAKVQGECCGPFANTFGGKPGKGCQMCGSMMYSEIMAAQPSTFYDNTTESVIGYFPTAGADGYTEAGTWLSYNDPVSAKAFVEYEKKQGLAGMFIYSTDMDTNKGGTYTYEMMNAIADAMGKK